MTAILVVKTAGEEFGLTLDDVMEIRRPTEIIPLPGAEDFVLGVAHVRGRPLPVFDFARSLGKVAEAVKDGSRFVVIKVKDKYLVLLVDLAVEVLEIGEERVSPKNTAGSPPFIRAVLDLAGRVILLVDLNAVFPEDKINRLAAG